MNEINFEQVSMSLLSDTALWNTSGRLENSTELYKLRDEDYLLVPTAEEQITNYVSQSISSYKNLPLLYYQVNAKFRNEKRPRGGLLRGKEFVMKDAYSFDLDELKAMETYSNVVAAYQKFFTDIKVPYIKAEADSGDIGGSLSHEWHITHETGEDTIFTCDSCGHISNLEKTLSFPQSPEPVENVAVRYFVTKDRLTIVCCYYPKDRNLDPNFVKNEISDVDLNETDQEKIVQEFSSSNEDDLISKKFIRIMDSRLNSRSNFPDFPFKFINRSLFTTLSDIPIVTAQDGEICEKCEDGELRESRAIEIGHTFYLGDKYSKPFNCNVDVPGENGGLEKRNLIMGCYGIGLSRIIATIGEINRDKNGLRWPENLAPWKITVIESKSDEFADFYNIINQSHLKDHYRLDDRPKIGLGKKVNHSNMCGIPLVVILGRDYPLVEIEVRGKRYNDNDQLAWKQIYQEKNKQFSWKVQYDDEGNDVKHLVHKDNFVTVVDSLLKDM
jgi:prolyl-tRNA synthetase